MKSLSAKRALQKGFTLVELSIVLVIAGLILVSVLKGTDAINKAKAERAVADLRELQGMLLEHQKRTGRLPGDCDNDGKIGFFPATTAGAISGAGTTPLLDAAEANRSLPTPPIGTGGTATCATAGTVETAENLVWNDMRRNNIVDSNRLPRELAKNVNGSYYAVGLLQGPAAAGAGAAASTDQANVIVVYNIPIWLAEAIDSAIDGTVLYDGNTSSANTGRIRRWDGNTGGVGSVPISVSNTYVNGFIKTGETRDSMIAISYQFDTAKLPN
jgi:prepilin-type N-terminal cleavage/methylation domain-containing protein